MGKKLFFSKTYFIATKVVEAEKQKRLEAELGTKLRELNARKGFRRIFEALLKRKAVLIGHNFIIDILFIISHFGDQIPNNFYEFKTLLRNYFAEYKFLSQST
jgi:hypothetical protein